MLFLSISMFNGHLATHTEDKKYICGLIRSGINIKCYKRFRTKEERDKHEKMVH